MVIPMSSGEYVLQIQSERRASDYRVDVPERLLDELGLSREHAKDVITRSVDWYRERDVELPPLLDLGITWDQHPEFRRFLTDGLSTSRKETPQ
jgi:hypothetical protein